MIFVGSSALGFPFWVLGIILGAWLAKRNGINPWFGGILAALTNVFGLIFLWGCDWSDYVARKFPLKG